MKRMLVLPLVVGLTSILGSTRASVWDSSNCNVQGLNGAVVGKVTDALCAKYKTCDKINNGTYTTVYKKQEACEEEAVCMWKQGACMQNRDVYNNVCNPPDVKINPVCNAITKGICPIQWQVKAECCEGEDGKYKENLESRDGFVCCNTPCESLEKSTGSNPDVCKWSDHRNNTQCGPSGKSFFGGPFGLSPGYGEYLPPDAVESMFGLRPGRPVQYGSVRPGFGYQGIPGPAAIGAIEQIGVGKSKEYHTDEITVDDLMDTLIYALDNDNDVFERNTEINSDPWFGKQVFGGNQNDFSLIDPYRFIDQIYGNPFGLSQAKLNYGELYGLEDSKFRNPSKGFEYDYSLRPQYGSGPSMYGGGKGPYGDGSYGGGQVGRPGPYGPTRPEQYKTGPISNGLRADTYLKPMLNPMYNPGMIQQTGQGFMGMGQNFGGNQGASEGLLRQRGVYPDQSVNLLSLQMGQGLQDMGQGTRGMGQGMSGFYMGQAQIGMGQGMSGQIGIGQGMSGQIGIGQGMSGQMGIGQGMPGQMGIGQGMSGQIGTGQGMSGQIGTGQGMPGQIGMGQGMSGQIGMGQGMPGQIGMGQGMPGQMGMGQGIPGQMGSGQGMPGYMGTGQGVPGQMGTGQGVPGQMGTGQGVPGQMGTDQRTFSQTEMGLNGFFQQGINLGSFNQNRQPNGNQFGAVPGASPSNTGQLPEMGQYPVPQANQQMSSGPRVEQSNQPPSSRLPRPEGLKPIQPLQPGGSLQSGQGPAREQQGTGPNLQVQLYPPSQGPNFPQSQSGSGPSFPPGPPGQGPSFPPGQSGSGQNFPPGLSGQGPSFPQSQSGSGQNLPPGQPGQGPSFPPGQPGQGPSFPPGQPGQGPSFPPGPPSEGPSFPQSQSGSGHNFPPGQPGQGSSFPPGQTGQRPGPSRPEVNGLRNIPSQQGQTSQPSNAKSSPIPQQQYNQQEQYIPDDSFDNLLDSYEMFETIYERRRAAENRP
ncbi:glutenin, high molecular weight subunit PW212 isoform X2 [Eurytemora carolleeae]|uniref:glutenin, high molecular weight subunit PW212 isoform X2 n=1 Tax=Eurytemora carolleeae TaxID=1294199 RepID=UPI000C78DB3E|nr:glutenin, high molecular weight subunit PW212 isoform X2 [Eurytemora carolleeae]|eukprot:XP_023332492.1 glutenin, high molecular weight subunit PW212-like isoform X2 [Eurytemora affinis]